MHPKIWRPKPCLLMFAFLVALDGFHMLLFSQLTVNLTPEWSGGSMFHPLSHLYAKTPFCCLETVANNALNCCCIVVFDRLWTQLSHWQMFMQNGKFTAFWYLPPLLSHATSIYDQPKWVCGFFLVFSWTVAKFERPKHWVSSVSVWLCLKFVYHLLTIFSDGAESK